MNTFDIITPTLFGVEAVTAKEIVKLGYDIKNTTDGRVTFVGDFDAVARANINLRTAERVLIKIAEFKATSFDELFENTYDIPWHLWLDKNAHFPVSGFSLKSKLHSVPTCQSIIKKAVVKSLQDKYKTVFLPERGVTYKIEFSVVKDNVTLMIDTTGTPLSKRGYRIKHNDAPLRESLASAIAILSRFDYSSAVADPFCGSGTFPIESAMIARNIAPGVNREFSSMDFPQISKKIWIDALEEARDCERRDTRLRVFASDIDKMCTEITKENAKNAGVSDMITVTQMPLSEFSSDISGGTILCNPPYGERMLEIEACERLYRQLGNVYRNLDNWSLSALTPVETFERFFGKNADKKRKLYNGMIKCCLYQYNKEKIGKNIN